MSEFLISKNTLVGGGIGRVFALISDFQIVFHFSGKEGDRIAREARGLTSTNKNDFVIKKNAFHSNRTHLS